MGSHYFCQFHQVVHLKLADVSQESSAKAGQSERKIEKLEHIT